jgi:MFS family permease
MSRKTLCKAVLLLAGTLTVMASAVMAPALPSIQAAFADTLNGLFLTKMILSGPALVIVLTAPLAGWLADRWGRRPLLLAGLALYALGGASGGFVDSLYLILAGRAVLGLGVAAIMTASIALIADLFQGAERARLLGLQQAFSHGGAIFLQVFSGALADITWRAPFYTYALSVLLLALALFAIEEPDRAAGAPSTRTGGPRPRLMIAIIMATAMTIMGCFYMIPVQLAFHLEEMAGATALMAGLAIAWMSACATATALLYGRVKGRIGHVWMVAAIGGVMSFGFIVLGLAGSYAVAIVALTIIGLGFGPMVANQAGWLTDIAPHAARGRAVGGLTLALFLGQFISTPAIQPVIGATSYGTAFIVSGTILAAVAAIYVVSRPWLVRRTAAHMGN